jgi:hypothetical protein
MIRKLLLLILLLGALLPLMSPLQEAQGSTPLEGGYPAAEFAEQVDQSGGQARSIFQNGETLIIGREGLTTLYDVGNMATPIEIGDIPNFRAQAMSGDYLYGTMEGSTSQWMVWNIGQPTNPLQVGTFQPTGRFLGSSDNYLIFENGSDTAIVIYSLVSPATPQQVGTWGIPSETVYIGWVKVLGDRLLVALYTVSCGQGSCNTFYRPVEILDLSDPTTPISIGQGTSAMSEREINTIANGYLYQADTWSSEGKVYISQIVSNPPQIIPVATIELGTFIPKEITVYSNTLYLATSEMTKIVDVSDPSSPTEIATVSEIIAGAIYENHLFGLSRFDNFQEVLHIPYVTIYDISNPVAPRLITTIYHPTGDVAIQANSTTLYLLDSDYFYYGSPPYTLVLHTVNISTPNQPQLVRTDVIGDFMGNGVPAFEMEIVQNRYLYLAFQEQDIAIYRLAINSDPLTYIGTIPTTGSIDILNSETTLVASRGDSEGRILEFYDITNPEMPVFTSQLVIEHDGQTAVLAEEHYVYVAGTSFVQGISPRIYIVDGSDASNPMIAGSFESNFYFNSSQEWTSANGYIYYPYTESSDKTYLAIADVTDPMAPTILHFPSFLIPYGHLLATDGQRLYSRSVSNDTPNLHVYELSDPTAPRLSTIKEPPNTCSYDMLLPNGDLFYVIDERCGLRTFGFVEGITRFLPMLYHSPE